MKWKRPANKGDFQHLFWAPLPAHISTRKFEQKRNAVHRTHSQDKTRLYKSPTKQIPKENRSKQKKLYTRVHFILYFKILLVGISSCTDRNSQRNKKPMFHQEKKKFTLFWWYSFLIKESINLFCLTVLLTSVKNVCKLPPHTRKSTLILHTSGYTTHKCTYACGHNKF